MYLSVPARKSVPCRLAYQLNAIIRPLCNMATYEQVKDVPNHPEIYLIDVREKEELRQTGSIPASLNIPLTELDKALCLGSKEFKSSYGRDKPGKDSKIIFSCRSGKRVLEAEKIAKAQGFSNVVIYKGSWLEWAQREGL
ncbi:rhodanese domain-containing protein CG4456 isoform X1 [Drosophila obscura]|uniref:rhodanese domain-containing protein CG4456 isoform X1 n=1 Tax=Drosophila obscura TaxID=7282 RepID=UPI000BA107DC|nr:rhodanese domain-containing protein CG4456 isoform X1 [Drosophila obscura]